MPLLSRRRSTLDVFMNDVRNACDGDQTRDSPSLSPAESTAPPTRRPSTAQPMADDQLLRPDTPPVQDATSATRRFAKMRWRHFSDTQLAATARAHAAQAPHPPLPHKLSQPTATGVTASTQPAEPQHDGSATLRSPPAAPAIITTAPTMEMSVAAPSKKQQKSPKSPKSPFKRQMSRFTPAKHLLINWPDTKPRLSADHAEHSKHLPAWRMSFDKKERRDNLPRASTSESNRAPAAPPAYGDESNSALALPVERLSVSSTGDRSSGEHVTYATTTTTHTISTTTTLFKLPRRNRRKSLFPLPAKVDHPPEMTTSPTSPRASTSAISAHSTTETPGGLGHTPHAALHRRHTEASRPRNFASPSVSPSHNSLARSAVAFVTNPPVPLLRNDSTASAQSVHSSPTTLAPPRRLGFRDRSSTVGSLGRASEDMNPPTPPTLASGRNSTSTTGRTSLGGFLSLNRFRHNSDANGRNTSPSSHSKTNSFAMVSREALNIPEREEGDTPGKYLERLQATVSRSLIAGILSKSSDPFAQAVLRSYSRKFPFFGEPIDMSLRKFLLEAELPKETQQVDRVIQAFADRYHECNPGIFQSSDKAYIIAFSIMMLHTDAFNKNNKRKMQKQDYIKNTSGQNVSDDVLACFYDNICYTPFIHFDEEVDINGERLLSFKPKKSKLRGTMPDPVRKTSGPIDPYALICDGKLDVLRPNIKDVINTDDPYTYLGTAGTLDIHKLQKAFVNTGILQIISARSRPAAFESQATRDNPNDTAAGVVDLKITKVGLLWRKNAKRKKTRSPWQEWGAIMTGSQLYLFKNINWVKGLMAQQHAHDKQGTNLPVVFHPPIQDFKPDALIKTDDAVALLDAGYTRHKDAFTLVRHGGLEEVLIAENEAEMNEWIALINYAAAFRSAGVRIRGFIGATETDPASQSQARKGSSPSASAPAQPGTEQGPKKQTMTPELVQQVLVFRGKIMRQSIFESEREIEQMTNSLESMLRNARHLLLLAPIQQKTREDVIHAAARMNANLKWVRRDIWRIKCHRDILAHDLEIDGDLLNEKISLSQAISPAPPATVRQAKGSQGVNSASTMSPPLSPHTPAVIGEVTEDFFGADVFRTPPEHARKMEPTDDWKLPPLDLNAERHDRLSVTSASQSMPRKPSTAGMSTSSSAFDRQHSFAGSDTASRPRLEFHTTSFDDREHEVLMLARDDLAPTITATTVSSAGAAHPHELASNSATPESASKPRNRRSLHRTLREARQDHASLHRHRRGKESTSSVKSDSSRVGDLPSDNAPVLERSTGKFIVHGKKASVVTFGGDWSEEKMRLAREIEARNRKDLPPGEADESGPEANLRRHIERELAASDDLDAFASDSTVSFTGRKPSDMEATSPVDGSISDNDQISPSTRTDASRGYFDIATDSATSQPNEGRPAFTQPVFAPPTQDIIRDPSKDVTPDKIPLPVSPPAITQPEHEEPVSTKYIADGTLQQLSHAERKDDAVQGSQNSQSMQAVGA